MGHRTTIAAALALVVASSAPVKAGDLEAGLDSLASALVKGLQQKGVKRLAVVEFTDIRGYSSALDPFLAEELTTRLFVLDPQLNIVERRQLQRVLDEHKLTASALFDETTIASVGRALGIQALVTGSISDLGNQVRVNARAISVDTAQVFAVAAATLPLEGSVEHLVRNAVAERGSGPAQQGRPTVQPGDAFYQNAFVRATVSSLVVTGSSLTVSLNIENLTNGSLVLGRDQTSIMDSAGNLFAVTTMTGMAKTAWHTLQRGTCNGPCTTLGPRERTLAVLMFGEQEGQYRSSRSRDMQIAAPFSLSMEMFRFENGKAIAFTIGIPNLRN